MMGVPSNRGGWAPLGASLYGADEMLALAAARQEWYIIGCPSFSTNASTAPGLALRPSGTGTALRDWRSDGIWAISWRSENLVHTPDSRFRGTTPRHSWRASPMSAVSRDCFIVIPFRVLPN